MRQVVAQQRLPAMADQKCSGIRIALCVFQLIRHERTGMRFGKADVGRGRACRPAMVVPHFMHQQKQYERPTAYSNEQLWHKNRATESASSPPREEGKGFLDQFCRQSPPISRQQAPFTESTPSRTHAFPPVGQVYLWRLVVRQDLHFLAQDCPLCQGGYCWRRGAL